MKIVIEADWNDRGLETTLTAQQMDCELAAIVLIEGARTLIEKADVELNDDILKSSKKLNSAIWEQLRKKAKGSDGRDETRTS